MGPCDKFGHQEITFSKDMYDKPYITTRSEPKLRECVLKS
jgi:hypothetical protein